MNDHGHHHHHHHGVARSLVIATALPLPSRIAELAGADFADCYRAEAHDCATASEAYRAIFGYSPAWMNALMRARNAVTGRLGLKAPTPAELQAARDAVHLLPYEIGSRAGLFTVRSIEADELVVGDDDRHLDFRISVRLHRVDARRVVSLSTVVRTHNRLGRAYLLAITPFHRMIARRFLQRAASAGRL